MEPVIEQLPDKSVNVFLNGMHFKMRTIEYQDYPRWYVDTEEGWRAIPADTKPYRWLNRLWIDKVHCARRPPGRIPRFPRDVSIDVSDLLIQAEKASSKGNMKKLAAVASQIQDLALDPTSEAKVVRWKDIPLASEAVEEDLEWLAEGRLPAKQVTVIAAHKDSYKTMLMLALAKAATTNGTFLGRPVKQMRVLYLNRDMPKAVFDSYCRTLRFDKSNRRFRILSSLWNTKLKPMQPDDKLLLRIVRRYKPVVIYDHFAKFYDHKMEDALEIDRFMEKFKQLTALGATVVVLHHLPKHDVASEGFGSVYIINGADFAWTIKREGGKYTPEETTSLKIQNTKTKMGDYFNLRVRPRLKTKRDFEVATECSELQEKWDREVETVKKLFSRTQWREKRDARKEAMKDGMSRARFNEIFDFCLSKGLLRVERKGRGLKRCRLAYPQSEE